MSADMQNICFLLAGFFGPPLVGGVLALMIEFFRRGRKNGFSQG